MIEDFLFKVYSWDFGTEPIQKEIDGEKKGKPFQNKRITYRAEVIETEECSYLKLTPIKQSQSATCP